MAGPPLGRSFFDRPVEQVARSLVGCTLTIAGAGGRIVEVEAYAPDDPASHSFGGPTARNAVMFGPPGFAYVYLSYGIHRLLNFSCGPEGHGAAVLIRALEPEHGRELIAARRPGIAERDWCRGPGRLAVALDVSEALNGLALDAAPFALSGGPARAEVEQTPRIGISRAVDVPWRFCERGSRWVSAARR